MQPFGGLTHVPATGSGEIALEPTRVAPCCPPRRARDGHAMHIKTRTVPRDGRATGRERVRCALVAASNGPAGRRRAPGPNPPPWVHPPSTPASQRTRRVEAEPTLSFQGSPTEPTLNESRAHRSTDAWWSPRSIRRGRTPERRRHRFVPKEPHRRRRRHHRPRPRRRPTPHEVPRTTIKPIARFNVRKPDPRQKRRIACTDRDDHGARP